MKTSLSRALATLAVDVPISIPPNWLQGRTAYGGLSAAMALHLVRQGSDESLPPLKAANISFVGPVTELAQFQTETLRKGKSVTQIGVDVRVNETLSMRASFIFGAARASQIQHIRVQAPLVEKPEHYALLSGDAAEIGHFQNFDIRFVSDARPVSGAKVPEMLAWVRLKESEAVAPEVAMLALGDCLPPAAMALFKEPEPISSIVWSINFPQPAAYSAWFLLRSSSLVAADGYSYQIMEMWDEDGNLVLISTQTVAIFI